MATNFPGGVSSQGIPLLPDIPVTTGTYYFVHSGTGSDNNTGLATNRAFATLQAAINKCTASKHDTIMVMPGHAETVTATSINMSKAGVRVVGVGNGRNRPVFTYNAAASTITVSAANCTWENCVHVANFVDVLSAFTLGAAKDFQLTDSEFVDTSAILNFVSVVTTNAVDNDADGLTLLRNFQWGLATTTALATVSILGACARVWIACNWVDQASVSNIGHFLTSAAKATPGLRVEYNVVNVIGVTSASVGVVYTATVQATSTGYLAWNVWASLDATSPLLDTATAGSPLGHFENYGGASAADKSGILLPAADNPA